MADGPSYSLALSDIEVERYRFMAQVARAGEAALWDRAGIVEGATIADIGCGPGLVLLELADVVGPSGTVAGGARGQADRRGRRGQRHRRRGPGLGHRAAVVVVRRGEHPPRARAQHRR